jgi:hypothetical protein
MSFDIYLNCFDHGKPAGVPVLSVRALFPVVDNESDPDYWKVRYGESVWCKIRVALLPTDVTLVTHLGVCRPLRDMRFWEAILAVMRLGAVALYFPGDAPPLVASEFAGQQLPRGMVEALGQPRVVQSASEIVEIIQDA